MGVVAISSPQCARFWANFISPTSFRVPLLFFIFKYEASKTLAARAKTFLCGSGLDDGTPLREIRHRSFPSSLRFPATAIPSPRRGPPHLLPQHLALQKKRKGERPHSRTDPGTERPHSFFIRSGSGPLSSYHDHPNRFHQIELAHQKSFFLTKGLKRKREKRNTASLICKSSTRRKTIFAVFLSTLLTPHQIVPDFAAKRSEVWETLGRRSIAFVRKPGTCLANLPRP